MNSKHTLRRRTMLRGVASGAAVAVGLPILDAMLNSHGTAFAGGGDIPVRMMTWCFGNGVILNRWIPGGIRNPVTGAGFPLPELLQPLAEVQNYVSVASGFDNKCTPQITHHEGMSIFNGYSMADVGGGPGFFSNARGPTVDQVYANWIDQQADKPPIVRGVHCGIVSQISMADYGTTMHNVSHVDHLTPNPPIKNAQEVYAQFVDLFIGGDSPSKPARLAVLDAVLADAKDLQKRLGKADKLRVDAHLDGLASLQNKINQIAPGGGSCELPLEPVTTTDTVDGMNTVALVMAELLVFAFSCDVTRIGSMLYVGGASEAPLVMNGQSQHTLSHSIYSNGLPSFGDSWKADGADAPPYSESGPMAEFASGVKMIMGHANYLAKRLMETQDAGDKNLLDNSIMLISSDCSDGWAHDIRHHPIVIVGGGGGRIKHPGVHVHDSNGRNASDVLLTFLQSALPSATEVGSLSYQLEGGGYDPCYSNTPCAELKSG